MRVDGVTPLGGSRKGAPIFVKPLPILAKRHYVWYMKTLIALLIAASFAGFSGRSPMVYREEPTPVEMVR